MRFLATFLLMALWLAIPVAAQQRPSDQPTGFFHPQVARDADRYEAYIKQGWTPAGSRKPADLRASGNRGLGPDPRGASRDFATAVVLEIWNAENWLGLARALLAIPPDPNHGSERYDLPVNASAAAFRAYEKSTTPGAKARALVVLSEALQRRSYWRPALDALKQSLALADDQRVRETYDRLRNEHGFRMVDYKADSDAASPRVCLQFSERLSRTLSDFSKFVSVDGKDPQNVVADERQLCIEGLAHGQRYEIKVRAGVPSDVGEVLEKSADMAVYLPDRKPFVRFTGKAYVLPSRGQQGVPIVSVNTNRIAVEVYRIGDRSLVSALQNGELQRQLSSYDAEQLKDRTGQKVYAGEMAVSPKLNEEVVTAFPVSDALGPLKPGAYVMIARPADKTSNGYNELATQWFVVSDLGLTALTGDDGVHVFVRSLATAEAVAAADVKLVAKNNEVLGTAKSDNGGHVHFAAGLVKGEGGLQPAMLVAEIAGGEYAFLDMTAAAFDLTDRGVKGREASGPLDAYIFAERGVYRPGESVYLTGLVRDRAGQAATLPVTVIVYRPDGVEYRRFTLNDQGLGGRSLTLALGNGAMTGTWRVKLHADPKADALAQVAFLVEDFVPERLELKLDPPAGGSLKPDQPLNIEATGRYLYGPPAANLDIEGDIAVKPSKKDVEGFPGYHFGLAEEKIQPVRKALEGLPNTGADGKATLAIALPQVPKTARPLEADVIIRLREPGGRTLERSISLPVDLGQPRIGIKPEFSASGLKEDEVANFEIISLDASSKRIGAQGLRWELSRLDTTWQWYAKDGSWAYEPITITRKVAGGTVDASAETAGKISAKVVYGRYRLDVSSADPDGPAASFGFSTGWFTSEENQDTPENLEIALDKAAYQPGDTAKLRIASKHPGTALIAVIGNGLISRKEVDVPKGGTEVSLFVGNDWGAGAYIAALMYRPMEEKAKRMPTRAIGVKWLGLDQSSRTLKLSLATPEKIKSGSTLTVPVTIAGLASGEEARVTVAAVDLGILNLTRYQVPAPESWFYAQRLLGVDIRDYYGRLIDGMNAERGRLRSGGDGPDGGGLAMDGSPPVEATVSLYSGIVTVGPDGTAKVDFTPPDFNGTVRVMAVAWSKTKIGHASKDVVIRDGVALTASTPRFLTLGDEARLDLSVHNVEGAASDYRLVLREVAPDAREIASRTLALKQLERKAERISIKPDKVGRVEYDVSVTGPNDIAVKRHLTIDVKPPANDIKRTTVSVLQPKGKLTLSKDLLHDLIASRSKVSVSVGPAAALDVAGVLAALDRYPYGCAEQTVSRALPLVYANAVAQSLGMGTDKAIRERVQAAVERVFEMQDSSGAFGVWGPSTPDLWLTAYVTDFLTRAKETGYQVRTQGFAQALDRLQNFISYAQDFKNGGEERAYALYVLARNGRAPIGELRYYIDTRLDRFATPLAKAQLGAAVAMMGDKERAEKAFSSAIAAFDAAGKDVTRLDFGSSLRDGAALVTLAAETGIAKPQSPRLVNVIAKAYSLRAYTSTQEQAWMLLAANALSDQAKQTQLTLNGQTLTGTLLRAFEAQSVIDSPVVITNEGDATDAVITVHGSALTPEPPAAKGFKVERSYYTLDGKPVDLKSATGGTATVKQNERLVAVVKIEAKEAGGRVLLVDRLPAGLEIENPRLVEGGDIKALDWLKGSTKPEHTEFRDDRFIAAFNFFGGNVARGRGTIEDDGGSEGDTPSEKKDDTPVTMATVAYIIRAVTPGTYIHPAVAVEDMYRPERYARSAAGKLTVTAKD